VLHTVVYGVLVVGGVCLVSLIGFELVQRLVPAASRQRHNDVAGFIYAALGVIYAVLLALVVISVWEEYQGASETVEEEANSVAEIFWLGYQLPEPEGVHLQELARSYAEEVVNKEWPLMAQGKQPPWSRKRGPRPDGTRSPPRVSTRSPARKCLPWSIRLRGIISVLCTHDRYPLGPYIRNRAAQAGATPDPASECPRMPLPRTPVNRWVVAKPI
jgi:hypothetical protein